MNNNNSVKIVTAVAVVLIVLGIIFIVKYGSLEVFPVDLRRQIGDVLYCLKFCVRRIG
jgi:hypothetical protein